MIDGALHGAAQIAFELVAGTIDRPGLQVVNSKQRSAPSRIANSAKRCMAIAGTHRALPADMYDADAIEAINFEQLATTTDRLLIRRGQVAKHRPSLSSLVPPTRFARGSHPHIKQSNVRRPGGSTHSDVFAITVVIPTLAGIAVGLAAML